MKKYFLIAVIVTLSGFNLVSAYSQSVSADDIDFGCQSVAGCKGAATCGGDGSHSGNCIIGCNNGGTLACQKSGGEQND
jgi:hypothetical protein